MQPAPLINSHSVAILEDDPETAHHLRASLEELGMRVMAETTAERASSNTLNAIMSMHSSSM
jgi:DNA-binding response OmpR family regulator